ncbi:ribosomal protein S18-alanine N-acetyltransferase [Microbacterium sp. MAHUQ-60]|uniref:ribosomal protein S18-alanine N-acetyltransferase n=1 Tax=unclassified Microbacterium TaxID=2609290 RepID=UPI003620091E
MATTDDLPAIMGLERRSFPEDAWSEQTMSAEVASAHNVYLVDVEDGRIVGYGGVRALQGGTDADIQTIALDADFRGSGRGRALLRALAGEAVGRGARELFLEVRADNPVAQALYVSEGFAELGRRPRYYQPGDVDAIVMRLDLREWAARAARARGAAPAPEEISGSGGDLPAEAPPIAENSSGTGGVQTARTDESDAAQEATA